MNLKKTALSCIMAALLPITANAQEANTANLEKSNTVNYRVGLSDTFDSVEFDMPVICEILTKTNQTFSYLFYYDRMAMNMK